jgi:hypothetical protein
MQHYLTVWTSDCLKVKLTAPENQNRFLCPKRVLHIYFHTHINYTTISIGKKRTPLAEHMYKLSGTSPHNWKLIIQQCTASTNIYHHSYCRAESYAWAVTCWLLTVGLRFNPGWLHVRFVVNKVALEQGFLQFLWFSLLTIIPSLLHTHLSQPRGARWPWPGSTLSHPCKL